jgi:hypothetical protein
MKEFTTVKKLKMYYLQGSARAVKANEFDVRFTGTPAAIRRLKRGVHLVLTNKDYKMTIELAPNSEHAARPALARKAAGG